MTTPNQSIKCENNLIKGLFVIENLLTDTEELNIINKVKNLEPNPLGVQLRTRSTKHYGYVFNAKTLHVDVKTDKTPLIPSWANDLISKFHEHKLLLGWDTDQLTINEYLPKTGISKHVDTHSAFEDNIVVISLGSDVTIRFENSITGEIYDIWVPRKSGLIMSDRARYLYTHRILFRSTDITPDGEFQHRGNRISLTFRKVLKSLSCNCQYKQLCDTQNPISIKPPNRLGNFFADQS
jgi:alkylated DNA repair protein alkB family protein 8